MRRRSVLAWLLAAWSAMAVASARADIPEPLDFNRHVRSILSNNCFVCHGPDAKERQAGLRLDVPDGAYAELDSGARAIVPDDPAASELIRRITAADADERMPPADSGKQLSADEIAVLTRWVREGGKYQRHWSYEKPIRPPLPDVTDAAWPRTGVDYFILARLAREDLHPSPEADRYVLIRRAALDLTGVPPTWDEVEQFVRDDHPQAYERMIDRLLARPQFGEHWARLWLDLARYADSAGYADDPERTIWAYRDWVIRAINSNLPFDQFTLEQLAGDLLPDSTEDQLIATAFHRNTLTNNEGGTNDEEFRNVAVVDRVNTTMAVWMGTTIACAQCHSHKYDPITQEEYFRLLAIFNQTEDADRRDETPVLPIFTDEQKSRRADLQSQIAALDAAGSDDDRKQLEELKKQLGEIKPVTTVPVLRELPQNRRRTTRIQFRGNFLDLGPEVQPGVPAVFHPILAARAAADGQSADGQFANGEPAAGPPADGESANGQPAAGPPADGEQPVVDRLALARWLVHPDNPLTARVVVNRYWEAIFGRGLVPTSEEFGSQGDPPTHPELLDWLATELVRLDWDTKALVKLLVMSAAYRQSSRIVPELAERDPDNVLLARGPRFRLSAEIVRDQALAVGGLLSPAMYGPPVRPPQPSLGVSAAFGSGIDWKASEGHDRYRRGLYTTWRRSNPYPSMVAFDAPNREVCTIRRDRTNTPSQALVLLNDPVYIEAAQALARRIAELGQTPEERARWGVRVCLSREPTDVELGRLLTLYDELHRQYAADPSQAQRMATSPLGPLPPGADAAEMAAWTVLANVLLNLDEMLMRR